MALNHLPGCVRLARIPLLDLVELYSREVRKHPDSPASNLFRAEIERRDLIYFKARNSSDYDFSLDPRYSLGEILG
ncbi:MAG TPA: hypothetical protein VJ783_03230 [Pirellulales bacterium]|nr:hypothetical protein [Pirellulales bacterium]